VGERAENRERNKQGGGKRKLKYLLLSKGAL
jgi:hypothetical protein